MQIPKIPSEMILASAGSGKTWQLTNRYIALMALQLKSGIPVEPERIIAVTFTRKAAGEFFDSILVKLAKAATDPIAAASLGADGKDPLAPVLASLSEDDYLSLLRIFIARMPKLFLGTLDSFFATVLGAFPAEFGLASDFSVMDDHSGAVAKSRVYDQIFQRDLGDPAAADARQKSFLEAFRLATFGKEEARIFDALDDHIGKLHATYLAAPSPLRWGDRDTIWGPCGCDFLGETDPIGQILERLWGTFEQNPDQVHRAFWDEFREELLNHFPGQSFAKRTKYMLPKLLPEWSRFLAGSAEVKFGSTVHEFDPIACECVVAILRFLIGGDIAVRMRRTRGVHDILAHYESLYADTVRRRGDLTFDDIKLLLAGHDYSLAGEGASLQPVFTQHSLDPDRLRIDYRLDARYDHWLLDEFQDTSHLEWRVISNLIDEVVQDESGTRSLFQVGDIKQAIFAWRGGDTRLFKEIGEHYNANAVAAELDPPILRRDLDVSWRSVAAILDPVNRLFGDPAALSALGLPDATLQEWDWSDHQVAPPNADQVGFTTVLQAVDETGGPTKDREARYDLVVAVLEELDPIERGLSCAIIVQKNDTGSELLDYIRAHCEIPVVSESDQTISTDNPLGLALLSAFQLAAHPGDHFAWEHLCMTPLRHAFTVRELSAGAFAREVALAIYNDGFEATTRLLLSMIESHLGEEGASQPMALDAFSARRGEAIALAARGFDETGSRDIDDFVAFLRSCESREAGSEAAVPILTIHKSKGLTYDAVILPDLQGKALTTERQGIGKKLNQRREIEWVLEMPVKAISEVDPTLAAYRAENQAEAAYEALCKYYVAMTRARFANYLIVEPITGTKNFPKLLGDVLGGDPVEVCYSGRAASGIFESEGKSSDRQWWKGYTAAKLVQDDEEPESPALDLVQRPRPSRRTASGSEGGMITAAQILSPDAAPARLLGTEVHELFETIEWYARDSEDHLPEGDAGEEAVALVRLALGKSSIQQALSCPGPHAEVWREKAFEVLIDDEWLSGIFDRVTLVDGTSEDIAQDYRTIIAELKAYGGALADKPRVTVLNKIDALDEEEQ
ncbi:MAG: UvrD-helicase domain-containing protein, partial [Verrucomicrobiota bacterium]